MPHPTLHDLLTLALPPGARVCHLEGLRRPVTGVVLLRPTAPALPKLHGGEVLLLTPASMAVLDARLTLATLLERLSGALLTAVVFLGTADDAACAAAQSARLSLIEISGPVELRDVQREIQLLLADQEAQMERRAAQLFSALIAPEVRAAGVSALLSQLRTWTGQHIRYQPGRSAHPGAVPVVVGGRQVAALLVDDEHPWALLAARQGAAALGLLLEKEQAVQATEDRLRGELVDVLISGLPYDLEQVRKRAAEQGYDLSHEMAALLISPEGGLALERLEAAVRREAERIDLHAPIGRRWSSLVCLVPCPGGDDEPARTLFSRVLAGGLLVSGGMSRPVALEGLPAATVEAERSALLGREVFGLGQLLTAADLGIYRLLLLLRDQPEFLEFHSRTIAPLAEYEGRPDGELLQTLRTFHAMLGNHSRTAEALHIHRNTLLYRLNRIAQITGLDLDDEEDRLALQIGLRIHRLIQSQANGR